jgi:hypothetical protein
VVNADVYPSCVSRKVVDPIGCYLSQFGIDEVINPDLLWPANRLVFSAGILEVADQFLLLGID